MIPPKTHMHHHRCKSGNAFWSISGPIKGKRWKIVPFMKRKLISTDWQEYELWTGLVVDDCLTNLGADHVCEYDPIVEEM